MVYLLHVFSFLQMRCKGVWALTCYPSRDWLPLGLEYVCHEEKKNSLESVIFDFAVSSLPWGNTILFKLIYHENNFIFASTLSLIKSVLFCSNPKVPQEMLNPSRSPRIQVLLNQPIIHLVVWYLECALFWLWHQEMVFIYRGSFWWILWNFPGFSVLLMWRIFAQMLVEIVSTVKEIAFCSSWQSINNSYSWALYFTLYSSRELRKS